MSAPPHHSALSDAPLPCDIDALRAFERLRSDCAYPWLLDSSLPDHPCGRYSFAGADPYWVLRARGEALELHCRRAVRPGFAVGVHRLDGDPLDVLRALLPPRPDDRSMLPFVGGVVGYLGYELAQTIEPVTLTAVDDLDLPDLVLLFVDAVVAHDHELGVARACAMGFGASATAAREDAERRAAVLYERVSAPEPAPKPAPALQRAISCSGAGPSHPGLDRAAHAKAVSAAKEEIAAGNVYQACLTRRIEVPFSGEPWSLYRALRRANPAPFGSYLELPGVAVASSSPERFLSLGPDRRVESRPIKGTSPRGRHPEEDAANQRALARSEKDRAENLMIVDLVRNDLGRVCETGSVAVPELMAVEAYASVFQMVSTVTGQLRKDRDAVDLIRAAFPPGSMTGAPKIAALELLDRLEPVRRGVYSGAIGYLDARGGADLSVVIRTIVIRGGCAYVHTGGGIVADSEPAAEFRETLDKARPLLAALEGR